MFRMRLPVTLLPLCIFQKRASQAHVLLLYNAQLWIERMDGKTVLSQGWKCMKYELRNRNLIPFAVPHNIFDCIVTCVSLDWSHAILHVNCAGPIYLCFHQKCLYIFIVLITYVKQRTQDLNGVLPYINRCAGFIVYNKKEKKKRKKQYNHDVIVTEAMILSNRWNSMLIKIIIRIAMGKMGKK